MSSVHSTINQHRAAIEALCRRYGVKTLHLFGSAGTERFDPSQSDIDFLVDYLPGEDLGPWLTRYFELKEEFERLLRRPVDLVFLSALKNPRFRHEAERTREVLYAA